MMSDPSEGPIAAASAPTAPQRATALARRATTKACSTTASEEGSRSAAPTACSARRDQRPSRRCKAAERGGGAEEREAEKEGPLAPDAIGDASRRHQQGAEHDRVRVEDPGELGRGNPRERRADRREGDEENRAVEGDDEHRHAGEGERPPG